MKALRPEKLKAARIEESFPVGVFRVMGDVKFYLVEGRMLIRPHKMPLWQKFRKYVRAVKPEHAVEKVYAELGSNHKIKRYHIVIERVVEVSPEEVPDRNLVALASLERWVKV